MKRLLLVGGGHAHLEVLRSIQRTPIPDTEVLLVSMGRFAAYSGGVPGYLAGRYTAGDIAFDLDALARAAGGVFMDEVVEQVDGTAGTVRVNGQSIAFDACSIDVGSSPAGSDVPGVGEHALPLRPLVNALSLVERFDALALAARTETHCVVVGGGAGGIEVALALAARGMGRVRVSIVHDREELLPDYPARARRIAVGACRRAGVAVGTGQRVESVARDHVQLAHGVQLPSVLTVWLAGAAPPAMLATSSVPRSHDGYLSVDNALRAIDGAPVWGAGDCITLREHPWVPKAGVYAVRQGPVLAHNLRVFLETHGRPRTYRPQSHFLSLVSTSDKLALLEYRGIAIESRWAQTLKGFIDRRFMNRYRVPPTSGMRREIGGSGTSDIGSDLTGAMADERKEKLEKDDRFSTEALVWLPDVTRFALSLTRDEADADDLVQETYLRAYQAWDTYTPDTECRGWLFTICRNTYYRQERREHRMVQCDDPELEALAAAAVHASADTAGFGNLFSRTDLYDALDRALAALPDQFREAVILVDVQDQSYATSAAVVGVPVGTIRSRLFRGRRLLQEALLEHATDLGLTNHLASPAAKHTSHASEQELT